MQRWVIGGACLLAILSSIGRGEEIGDSKQLKESVRTKGTEFSAEKQAIDDLNFDNLTTPLESSKNLTSSSQVLGQTSSEETLSVNTPLKENFIQPLAKKSEEDVGENSSLIPQGSASLNVDQNAKFISKEHKETDKNDNVYSSGLNILPPLYSAPLTASSNKAVRDESPFSPVFSRDITDHSVYELPADPQNNLKRAGFGTLPSYSYISKTAFEESRRESKPDDLQTRDIDEREYSETRNAYPYSSSSGKLDTTSGKTNELRSGLTYAPSYPLQQNTGTSSAQAYAGTQVQSLNDKLSLNNQGYNPYSFGYPPDPVPKPISTINANAQASANGMSNAQSSATVIEDAKSRIIWPNELIFPSKIPGAENEIQCTRENEMYHYWSRSFECLICICLNVYGLLEPICAKCSGCRGPQSPAPQTFIPDQSFPTPDTYRPLPVPDSYVPLPILSTDSSAPSAPSLIVEPIGNQDIQLTTQLPVREVPATCRPLPTDRPFTNPLHPCQICICRETITSLGKIDVRIECQDNNDCVLPVDVTPLPIIPDIPVPVPLPHCEKFPPHVPFPHPTDSCKLCKCSLQLSSEGLSEQQITCYRNTDCVKKIEVTSEPITPPAPPIPIPVEPYPGPVPQPAVKPIPENYQKDLIPWPPISTPAPPLVPLLPKKGPLPGPSPHDSCRPYPPNQSFQHPWDDCQVCQCTETKAIGVVNVEINCYTKLSCCIESPENVISAAAEASSGSNIQAQGYGSLNILPVSTIKPPQLITSYKDGPLNQGYAEATAVAENSGIYSYGAAQGQTFAEANAVAQNTDTYNLGSPSYYGAEANAIVQNSANDNEQHPQNQGYFATNGNLQNLGYNVPHNQGFGEASAIAQNNINIASNPLSGPNQLVKDIVIGDDHLSAIADAAYATVDSFKPELSQSLGYAEANALTQNSVLNPLYSGSYQSANAFSNVNGGQTSANANAEYNNLFPLDPYNLGISQNQAYVANANAAAQSLIHNSGQQPPGAYAIGNIHNVETSEEYIPLSATFKPPLPYQYISGIPQKQAYLESITKNSRLISTTYKPPTLYDLYNTEVSQNQAYADASAQYNGIMTDTPKGSIFNQYVPGIKQNQAFAKSNALYNRPITSTYKPPSIYNLYDTELSQNQAFAQANGHMSSTLKPAALYGGYNPAMSQNQAHATANALYKGALSLTDKPPYLFHPYNTKVSQTQTHSGANAVDLNSLANQDYYLSGPYQTASALSSANGGDQSLAIAEAIAQSQDYSPYLQPGPILGTNLMSSPLGYPQQPNYYNQNQRYSPYINKADTGLNGQYKTSPVKYAGNYDFNGQADAINILSSQNRLNPYGSAYAQSVPSMYSSAYPNPNMYDISSVYRPIQYGGSGGQSAAQANASAKSQSKSGEGFEE